MGQWYEGKCASGWVSPRMGGRCVETRKWSKTLKYPCAPPPMREAPRRGGTVGDSLLLEIRKEAAQIKKRVTKVWCPPRVLIDVSKHYMQIGGRRQNMGLGPLKDGFIRFAWARCWKIRGLLPARRLELWQLWGIIRNYGELWGIVGELW